MFPTITISDVVSALSPFWANTLVTGLLALVLALALIPRILRVFRGILGRR